MLYRDFAKIIKEKREDIGISQKDMAMSLGLNRSSYNKIENGKMEPSFSTLQAICRLLSLDLTEILELKKPRGEHIRLYD